MPAAAAPFRRALLSLAFLSASAPAADPIHCPETVTVRQQIASPVQGWTPAVEGAAPRLAGITFFDGDPKEQASLAPDGESKVNGKTVATWKFEAVSTLWVACRYASTTVTLTKPLPKAIKSCSITFNRTETIAGLPSIEKVDCR